MCKLTEQELLAEVQHARKERDDYQARAYDAEAGLGRQVGLNQRLKEQRDEARLAARELFFPISGRLPVLEEAFVQRYPWLKGADMERTIE